MSDELVAMLNRHRGGFNELLDLRFTAAGEDAIIAELTLEAKHTQPYGIVHGGVYAAAVETVCSTAAAVRLMSSGHGVVGLDNHTTFLRATRGGTVTVRATPLKIGRRTHVWRAECRDGDDRLLATGQVRLMVLEPGEQLAGQAVPSRRGD